MSAAIPAQDSGEALVGRECWVWDNTSIVGGGWVAERDARRRIVMTYRAGSRLPYATTSSIYTHALPVELGHPDPNHPSHKDAKMTELEQARKAYEELGAKLKALEEKEKAKRPKLGRGQIWMHDMSGAYIAAQAIDGFLLVNLADGNRWSDADADQFDGQAKDFTYLGMACDLLTIKGQP